MKFFFIIERTRTGYSAYERKKAIFTTGETLLELQVNALEATNLYLEDEGKRVSRDNLAFEIDFKQFFEFYKVINAKYLAERIGMNESLLSQYVTGKKRPSKRQVERIIDGLQQIGRELMEINLV